MSCKAAGPPNCDDYEGDFRMNTSRAGRTSALLTLTVLGLALCGQVVRADAPVAQKAQASFFPQAPVVKLDSAMLQERTISTDGSVHVDTYLNAVPTRNAQAPQTRSAKLQTPAKA